MRCSAVLDGTAMGTVRSKGAGVQWSWYVTVCIDWSGLWGWLSGCSAYIYQVFQSDVLSGPPDMFFHCFDQVALIGCCFGCDGTGDICTGLCR